METEYDHGKAQSNLKKHGLTFEEASTALLDEQAVWIEDPSADGENRWIFWGLSERLRLLAVVVTLRGDRIRIISARKATKTEAKAYAQRI